MKLQAMIDSISPDVRDLAIRLMKSEDFFSLKEFEGGYEAFIKVEGGILLPGVVLDDESVIESECQCQSGYKICIHVAAMLLGIKRMLQAGCCDYHEAIEKSGP